MFLFKIKGYILLTVMIFLQIFSALGMAELFKVLQTKKLNQHRWLHESLFLKSKQMLTHIEKQQLLDANLNCEIPYLSVNEFPKKSLDWWQVKGCLDHMEDIYSYYVIERIGQDECGFVIKEEINQVVAANYYRITLYSFYAKNSKWKIILQSTLAKASTDPLSCTDKRHQITVGRQTLREL